MDNEAPFIVVNVWGAVAGFSWIVWVIATNVRIARVSRHNGRTQADLVERLASSQELMGFLQTEAGQRLFAEAPEIEPRRNPIDRIRRAAGSIGCGSSYRRVLSEMGDQPEAAE